MMQQAMDHFDTARAVSVGSGCRRVRRHPASRWVGVFLALWFLALGGSGEAFAQSTAPSTTTGTPSGADAPVMSRQITRTNGYRSNVSRRYWISYEDCLANDVFTFPLTLPNNNRRLEVWVGNDDCAARRGLDDRGQCWIVAAYDRPTVPTHLAQVAARDVIARRLDTLDIPDPDALGTAICNGSTDPDGEKLTFYFILEEGSKAAAYTTWPTASSTGTYSDGGAGYDLVGPAPPTAISVGIGERQLSVRINGVDDDPDRERFEAFCVPKGTVAEGIDAGAGAGVIDAGTGGGVFETDASVVAPNFDPTGVDGGAAPDECYTPLLRQLSRPPIPIDEDDPNYSCGISNETASTLQTTKLTNGVTYAVGVAGQDTLGNAGELSEIKCGTPVQLDDFYEVYSGNGGKGGGGFCSLSFPPAATRGNMTAALSALGLAAVASLRRRRGSRR